MPYPTEDNIAKSYTVYKEFNVPMKEWTMNLNHSSAFQATFIYIW